MKHEQDEEDDEIMNDGADNEKEAVLRREHRETDWLARLATRAVIDNDFLQAHVPHNNHMIIHDVVDMFIRNRFVRVINSPGDCTMHCMEMRNVRIERPSVDGGGGSGPVNDDQPAMIEPKMAHRRNLNYQLNIVADVLYSVHTPSEASMPAIQAFAGQSFAIRNQFKRRSRQFRVDGEEFIDISSSASNCAWINMYKDATVKNVFNQERYCILQMPCMVGSVACNVQQLPRPPAQFKFDNFGQYIVGGNDKIIPAIRRLAWNRDVVFSGNVRVDCSFENRSCHWSRQYHSTATMKITYTAPRGKCVYPSFHVWLGQKSVSLYVLFVALGWHPSSVVLSVRTAARDRWTPDLQVLFDTLSEMCPCDDEEEALYMIAKASNARVPTQSRGAQHRADMVAYARLILRYDLLPHITHETSGTDECLARGLYLGFAVWRILCAVVVGKTSKADYDLDDRDHIKLCRFDTSATMLGVLTRQVLDLSMEQAHGCMNRMLREKKPVNVKGVINTKRASSLIRYPVSTGLWSARKKGITQCRTNVAQSINTNNPRAYVSHLTRIMSSSNPDRRMSQQRLVHLGWDGFIDPSDTSEGKQCGNVVSGATHIQYSAGSNPNTMRLILQSSSDVYGFVRIGEWCHHVRVGEIDDATIIMNGFVMVLVDGIIVGWVRDRRALVKHVRLLRDTGCVDRMCSVHYDEALDVVRVRCDKNRLVRPLLNIARMRDLDPQSLDLPLHVLHLMGVVVYLDGAEIQDLAIAYSMKDLRHRPACTHCEIDASWKLGVNPSLIPGVENNQAPRNTYQSCMGKQAMSSLPEMSSRTPSGVYHMYYSQKPLCTTTQMSSYGDLFQFSSTNATVAVAMVDGFDQEDSIVVRRSFFERGGCLSSYERVYKDEQRKGSSTNRELFHKPCASRCIGMKMANYDKLQSNGVPKVGTKICNNDVVIGKSTFIRELSTSARAHQSEQSLMPSVGLDNHNSSSNSNMMESAGTAGGGGAADATGGGGKTRLRRDGSHVHYGRDCVVVRVVVDKNANGHQIRKVVVRWECKPAKGDKFSTLHGQKGTVSIVANDEDCMFSMKDGIIPDVYVTSHGYPGRMTMAQPKEQRLSKAKCLEPNMVNSDVTAFRDHSANMDMASQVLLKHGFGRSTKEIMIDGKTGRVVNAAIAVGPVSLQRLRHLVNDKIHARSRGPIDVMTRQPVEGRSKDGGLRLGEMERDVLIAYGSSAIISELMRKNSDEWDSFWCGTCGLPAICDARIGNQGYCKFCPVDEAQVYRVTTVFPWKQMVFELMSMGIYVHHEIQAVADSTRLV